MMQYGREQKIIYLIRLGDAFKEEKGKKKEEVILVLQALENLISNTQDFLRDWVEGRMIHSEK